MAKFMLAPLVLFVLLFGGSIVVSWLAQLGRGGKGLPREISG
jgi:hypothetical protein